MGADFERYPAIDSLNKNSRQLPTPLQRALGDGLLIMAKSTPYKEEDSFGTPIPKSMGADAIMRLYKTWYNDAAPLDRAFEIIRHLPAHRQQFINGHCHWLLSHIDRYTRHKLVCPRTLAQQITTYCTNVTNPAAIAAIPLPPSLQASSFDEPRSNAPTETESLNPLSQGISSPFTPQPEPEWLTPLPQTLGQSDNLNLFNPNQDTDTPA